MRFNLFRQSDVPEKYRSNFSHLYLDIAWFGVLSGTAVNFLMVYATRLGALWLWGRESMQVRSTSVVSV